MGLDGRGRGVDNVNRRRGVRLVDENRQLMVRKRHILHWLGLARILGSVPSSLRAETHKDIVMSLFMK